MRIAYVISESYSINKFNGIRMQAETWAKELAVQGENVTKINPWEKYDWEQFDIIHIFGPCEFILNFTKGVSKRMPRIVFSPIIDTIQSVFKYKIATHWGISKLRLTSPNYTIRQASKYIKSWIVRSEYELEYVHRAYGIPFDKICVIPLSFRVSVCEENVERENFCLHVSKLTDERKNVKRLILAAIKYNFKLVLAGGISCDNDFSEIKSLIDNHDNISYLGRISDEYLLDLYSKAKVFALPSINEGVGLVAVEAAACGCDIVITKIGGPKEYYADMAKVVNPYNLDEIGEAIMFFLNGNTYQPVLREYVESNFCLKNCVRQLRGSYQMVIQNSGKL